MLENWEAGKQREQKDSILDGVPKSMPALLRAQRIGEKAARLGFDWAAADVKEKVVEEAQEFIAACATEEGDEAKAKEEFGDLLFTLSQLGRKMDFNTEELLNRATDKFSTRFKRMEKDSQNDLQSLDAQELDGLWEQAKAKD